MGIKRYAPTFSNRVSHSESLVFCIHSKEGEHSDGHSTFINHRDTIGVPNTSSRWWDIIRM